MTEGMIFLELQNQLSELDRLQRTFEEFGQRHGLPARLLSGMNLALEEIVTNIISYGFADTAAHTIRVGIFLEQGELRAVVEDDGKAFNPLVVLRPDTEQPLEQRPVGGLGIHLVRTLMDDIVYERQEHRNVLVLKKKVPESETR
jgi:anti-sigma regulatory factor (Ser/Thr protein kinase)